MRRFAAVLLVVGLLAPAGEVAASRKCDPKRTTCPGAAVKYKNCTALRAVHRAGVARDAAAAGKTGAHVDADLYKMNAGMDRDRDGIACES